MKKAHASPERDPKIEARLDRAMRDVLHQTPEKFTPEQWRAFRERCRLFLLYPGKSVVYLDHYEGQGNTRRLVYREVICACRTLAAASGRILKLPLEMQRAVGLMYIEPDTSAGNGLIAWLRLIPDFR
jgi:hypothetical protein